MKNVNRVTKEEQDKATKEIRYAICKYVEDNPDATIKAIAEVMKTTASKIQYHCIQLEKSKHLASKYKVIGRHRVVIYRRTKLDIDAPAQEEPKPIVTEKSALEKATRVIRLMDNPLPQPEKSKKRVAVHIGSGMSLFNNY